MIPPWCPLLQIEAETKNDTLCYLVTQTAVCNKTQGCDNGFLFFYAQVKLLTATSQWSSQEPGLE